MNRIRSIERLGLLVAWTVAAATLRTAPAAITVQDGVPWVYQVSSDGGATILHGPGCGDVTIPAQLDCYPVMRIGTNVFFGCIGLTSMTIPDSVTNIGHLAFSGCTGLATLYVPVGLAGTTQVADSGVPCSCTVLYGDAWEKVDGAAWSYVVYDDTATVTAGPREGAITIPSVLGGYAVTDIGSNAFYFCSGLTSVRIPASVTSIAYRAFSNCAGLTNVMIGTSVTSIGKEVFSDCFGLTSVTIPDSVANIGEYAFIYCSGLTNMTVGGGVTNIGSYAFADCSGLTSVTIPGSVTGIGDYAFHYCSGLTNMTVDGSVTNIGRGMVEGCSHLATMNVPEAWRSLYLYDFRYGYDVFWSEYAGVPSGCAIVYYEPAAPGVTATGVPHEWLEEKAGEALAAAGGDYEAAAKAAAANGRAVWECYVAGLDPRDAEKDFTTEITFSDGVPKVSWNPDLNAGGKTERVYRAWARKSVEEEDPGSGTQDGWRDVTGREASWAEEGWRFFRVGVELPGGGARSEK